MTSLDDLRATLDQHATDVAGVSTTARTAAVHDRVGVVRRRRRAVTAAGTAAVLATVAGVALQMGSTDRGPAPAGTSVFGLDVPQEVESLGFTYSFADVVDGDGRISLQLPASDEPRLVSWGTSGVDDAVSIAVDDASGVVHEAPDFTDWVIIAAGRAVTVRASAVDTKVALATYTLTAARPEGVSGGGLTYRQQTADAVLLAAEVGDLGQGEITLPATAATRGTRQHFACTGLDDDDLFMHEESPSGTSVGEIDCSEPLPVDGVTGETSAFASSPGEDVTSRFYITRGEDGPIVDDPRLRIAGAVYALESKVTGGLNFPSDVEYDGHSWTLVDTRVSETGELDITVPADGGTVLAMTLATTEGAGEALIVVDAGGEVTRSYVYQDVTPVLTDLVGPGARITTGLEESTGTGRLTVATGVGLFARAD